MPVKHQHKSNTWRIALALLLLCVLGTRILSPAMGYTRSVKEIATTTGESDDKTNSEKQADNQEDFNIDKILSANYLQQVLKSAEIANEAPLSAYINHYFPTHHFTIISPPPDFFSVLKS